MTIERDTVIETILDIAQTQPERNNNGACIYVLDDKPNCVAAAVAERLGLDWESLQEYEGDAAPQAFRATFPGRFTEEALDFLNIVQTAADGFYDDDLSEGRKPWGECVKVALTVLPSDLEG